MMDSRQNAVLIAVYMLVFNMSIILVASVNIYPSFGDEEDRNVFSDPLGNMLDIDNWDWVNLLFTGTGIITVAMVAALRLPVGAAVFAITFGIFMNPMTGATLRALARHAGLPNELSDVIRASLAVMYLYAFVRLSST